MISNSKRLVPTHQPQALLASKKSSNRLIAHLDMDAFFASVELLRQPQLKGLPLVIGGKRRNTSGWLRDTSLETLPPEQIPLHAFKRLRDYTGRGVITTATYEARQFGVGSAMGLMKAAILCPDAYLLPVDFTSYEYYSRIFKKTLKNMVPIIEDRGIDEVYLDLSCIAQAQEQGGLYFAKKIQANIFNATGLSCSIGITRNKMLSKLASEWHKPGGICILPDTEIEQRIWPLECRKLNGIGPKTAQKLKQFNILTLGQLAQHSAQWLRQHFGKTYGNWLYDAARGIDERPLVTRSKPVSMSRETTFEQDLHAAQHRNKLSEILIRLCEQVANDLKRKGYVARTIGIKIRYADFIVMTRVLTIDTFTQDERVILHTARQCLKRVDLTKKFRLLGVKTDNLIKLDLAQSLKYAALSQSSLPNTSQSAAIQLGFDFD